MFSNPVFSDLIQVLIEQIGRSLNLAVAVITLSWVFLNDTVRLEDSQFEAASFFHIIFVAGHKNDVTLHPFSMRQSIHG